MHKFVTTSSCGFPTPLISVPTDGTQSGSVQSHSVKVQMSGYLKKKRNKVGGWRKMWFVLQDQLLLSYSSKDYYDKKLVSFKDVLNLVPGTVVRPLGESRFTIETATNLLYTFRCDDNKTCTEWMTKLVEGLTMKGKTSNEIYSQKFQNISMDNIRTGPHLRQPIRISYSCDSISLSTKPARIPIANTTARILERNGLSAAEIAEFNILCISDHSKSGLNLHINRAWNFRLHEENLPQSVVDQSNVVCRINQMFHRTACSQNDKQIGDEDSSYLKGHHKINLPGLFALLNLSRLNTAEIPTVNGQMEVDLNQNNMISATEKDVHPAEACCSKLNCNCGSPTRSIEKEIQQLSLRGSCSDSTIISENNTPKMTLSSSSIQSSLTVKRISSCPPLLGNIIGSAPQEKTISPSLSGSSASMSSVDHHSSSSGSCRGVSTSRTVEENLSLSSPCLSDDFQLSHALQRKHPEPIYAVVDLRNKYERRARMKEEAQLGAPDQLNVTSSDYEEVLHFSNEYINLGHSAYCANDVNGRRNRSRDEDENENIYEPINIPERSFLHPPQRHVLWKYFPRISIEALIEMVRNKRKELRCEQSSPFSDIRKKLGNHRRSIKTRVKKIYGRNTTEHKERNVLSEDEQSGTCPTRTECANKTTATSNSQIPTGALVLDEKLRSGEKHFFGSFSRFQKTRIRASLCLEGSTYPEARKQLLMSPTNPCLQTEKGQEDLSSNATLAHIKSITTHNSKFYD